MAFVFLMLFKSVAVGNTFSMLKKSVQIWFIVGVCLASFSSVFVIVFSIVYRKHPIKFQSEISVYAKKYDLEEAFVFAVISAESNFDKNAVSESGAVGLMQIMPMTANWISVELDKNTNIVELKDAKTNIEYGCFYLRYLFDKFGNDIAVLCAYNAGEGVVFSWLDENGRIEIDDIPFIETKNYVKSVLSARSVYREKLE